MVAWHHGPRCSGRPSVRVAERMFGCSAAQGSPDMIMAQFSTRRVDCLPRDAADWKRREKRSYRAKQALSSGGIRYESGFFTSPLFFTDIVPMEHLPYMSSGSQVAVWPLFFSASEAWVASGLAYRMLRCAIHPKAGLGLPMTYRRRLWIRARISCLLDPV